VEKSVPRSLGGSSAISLALLVVLTAFVPASGAGIASPSTGLDTPPSTGAKGAPSLKENKTPICNVSPSVPAYTASHPWPGGPNDVCGSFKDDSLWVTDAAGGGTSISAELGNDAINAQNTKIDYIWGGPGDNSAKIDWCLPDGKIHDETTDVAHVKKVKVKCTGVKRSSRRLSAAAITYPYEEPLIDCTVTRGGQWRVAVAHEPVVRAVDATANVDWQTVAFSALLYQWSATDSQWVLSQQSQWVRDHVPDDQLEGFPANFWQPFGKTGHEKILFTPATSGKYRVAIRYHWYAANGIKDHDELVWASFHFDHFASANFGECDFPGHPPPDGQYTGTTDEGKAVTFTTGPIWITATREVAGTRLTNVTIASTVTCSPALTLSYSIAFVPTRWIQLNYDNTFAYAASSPIRSTTRQNVTATYSITGKIDLPGSAAGSVSIWQLSFDQNGTHYDCAGKPHLWTAKVGS
jgi:hypothetical protein